LRGPRKRGLTSTKRTAGTPTYYYTDSYDVLNIYEAGGPNKWKKFNP